MPQDDAPNATAKHTHGDREVASRAVTINRPVEEVYAFFRDLTKAPLYMDDVASVTMSGNRAHWVSRATDGDPVEWDADITNDVPNTEMTWQAVDGTGGSGRATFEDVAGRGTVLTLTMAYDQPGGIIGKMVGKLTQDDPAIQQRRNLRRLKQLLETGEIATNARNGRMFAEENQ